MAREGCDGTSATFPLPLLAYDKRTFPPSPLPGSAVQIAGRTLAKRRASEGGKNGGWYLHVPPLWAGVKSDSTVSNSFPRRAARAQRERPGWQMTPNICVMQPLQMRDFTSQSLPFCLSTGHSLSPPTTLTSGTTRRMTDLPWKLPWNGL